MIGRTNPVVAHTAETSAMTPSCSKVLAAPDRDATSNGTDTIGTTTRGVARGSLRRKQVVLPVVSAVLLVLVQIYYPLSSGAARDQVTIAIVVLSAATALIHATSVRGLDYAAGFLTIVSGLGLLSEIVGTATGFPFGAYDYSLDRLGPTLAGVPLVVPLAWTGGIYPIWVVSGFLVRRAAPRMVLLAIGALGWDLFLDPQMVADGQWHWYATEAGLPGIAHIPYTNYLGWLAVTLVMAALLTLLDRLPRLFPTTPSTPVPVAVFLWTWLGSTLAHAVFLDLPVSACYGGSVLALLGVPLLIHLGRTRAKCIRFG